MFTLWTCWRPPMMNQHARIASTLCSCHTVLKSVLKLRASLLVTQYCQTQQNIWLFLLVPCCVVRPCWHTWVHLCWPAFYWTFCKEHSICMLSVCVLWLLKSTTRFYMQKMCMHHWKQAKESKQAKGFVVDQPSHSIRGDFWLSETHSYPPLNKTTCHQNLLTDINLMQCSDIEWLVEMP